jgi:hypothetical protein
MADFGMGNRLCAPACLKNIKRDLERATYLSTFAFKIEQV